MILECIFRWEVCYIFINKKTRGECKACRIMFKMMNEI